MEFLNLIPLSIFLILCIFLLIHLRDERRDKDLHFFCDVENLDEDTADYLFNNVKLWDTKWGDFERIVAEYRAKLPV